MWLKLVIFAFSGCIVIAIGIWFLAQAFAALRAPSSYSLIAPLEVVGKEGESRVKWFLRYRKQFDSNPSPC